MSNRIKRYTGRFAPSPTGPLHFGSLVTAVASYLQARSHHGIWRVRLENIDPAREPASAKKQIFTTLQAYGFHIDGKVILQANHLDRYRRVIEHWRNHGLSYACSCSRAMIQQSHLVGLLGPVYPGTCRNRNLRFIPGRHVLRLCYPEHQFLRFNDQTYGWQFCNTYREDGDFVIYRREKWPSYALASSIDDLHEGYSEIVRGADLLEHTFRQYRIYQLGRRHLPHFRHIPIVVDAGGNKLSKQNQADPLPVRAYRLFLFEALNTLGQRPPRYLHGRSLRSIWDWAVTHWDPQHIAAVRTVPYFLDK